jgi:hypothetical protein
MKVHTHSKKRFVQFRIDDQELYRALKTLSRQPKDRGYSRQQGSVAGVIKKLLLENLAPELKALAEDARSGGGKIANPSGTVQLSPQDSDMERNKASGLPNPPPLRVQNAPWRQQVLRNHTIKLSIPEKNRNRSVILDAPNRTAAEEECFAYAWFTLLCRSYHASEHKDLSDVNSLRSVNELGAIKRWPGWAEMAHLACQAYLRHPHYFSEWCDWVEA